MIFNIDFLISERREILRIYNLYHFMNRRNKLNRIHCDNCFNVYLILQGLEEKIKNLIKILCRTCDKSISNSSS